jgi:hypothetical protein
MQANKVLTGIGNSHFLRDQILLRVKINGMKKFQVNAKGEI